MKKTIFAAIAASFLLGGCATSGDSATSASTPGAKASSDEYVTGSRLRRTETNENYQGSKTMTGKDYRDYKASQGTTSN